ncbi:1015_t:CDS:2, partial [Scutellospora calospora]
MIATPAPIFYKSVHTCKEHHIAENIANRINNMIQETGINKYVGIITDNTKNMKAAWNILKVKYLDKLNLKKLWDFLEPFINFIHCLESDEPYLSSAYKNLQELKNTIINNLQVPEELQNETLQAARSRWVNILYNSAVIIAYTLDPRYQSEDLDFEIWGDIINKE